MRNLIKVINEIIEVVPKENVELIEALQRRIESVSFTAPEIMYLRWDEVYTTLCKGVSEPPTDEWHYKVWSIFSTKSIDEIKSFYA